MSLGEHEAQLRESEPWHVDAPRVIGDQEITLLALIDSTGLVEAGALDLHGTYLTADDLRQYVMTLQDIVAKIDALASGDGTTAHGGC